MNSWWTTALQSFPQFSRSGKGSSTKRERAGWRSAEPLEMRQLLTGLVIHPTFDSSITSNSHATAIEATINQAIAKYQSAFTDPITVNITFKIDATVNLGHSDSLVYTYPYATYLNQLSNRTIESEILYQAWKHLPNTSTDPVLGQTNLYVTSANMRALNHSFVGPASDGTISFNLSQCSVNHSSPVVGKYDLMGVVEHEIDEVLGVTSALKVAPDANLPNAMIEDLYRYDSTGHRSFTRSTSAVAWYSLDGSTQLMQLNQDGLGDYGDFADTDTAHIQDAHATPGIAIEPNIEFNMLYVQGYHLNTPDGNMGPVNIKLSNDKVQEHSNFQTIVGKFSSVDADPITAFTYELVDGPGSDGNSAFNLGSDGTLHVNQIFDLGTKSFYYIRVRSTDQYNFSYEKVFAIKVTAAHAPRTITVDTLSPTSVSGYTSLGDAINTANFDAPGDTIVFKPGLTGTILLTHDYQIINSMTIQGPGANLLTISGNDKTRLFEIDDKTSAFTSKVTISGLTLTHGLATFVSSPPSPIDAWGGAILNGETLNLFDDVISNSFAVQFGGGIYNFGLLVSSGNTWSGNNTSGGGAIFNTGSVKSSNDTFFGNGGGGAIFHAGPLLTTINDTITNSAGLGILIGDSKTWNSLNTIVDGNTGAVDVSVGNNATVNARNTLVGKISSGMTSGVNGNIVGPAVDTVLATNASGVPVLTDNGGPTPTILLSEGTNPAIGVGGIITTLSKSATADDTVLMIPDGTFIPIGAEIRIDSEIMRVVDAVQTAILVERGAEGTTAQAHAANAPLQIGNDQRGNLRVNIDLGAVTALNHAPVGTPKTVITSEDTPYAFTAADFGFTDPKDLPANQLLAVKIVGLPAVGTLKLNGSPLGVNARVLATDIASGKLTFAPVLNGNGNPYTTFLFRVQDNGGNSFGGSDTDLVSRTMTVRVTPVNDAPVLNAAGNPTLTSITKNIAAASNLGTSVSQLISNLTGTGGSITDVDAAAVQGIAVTSVDQTHGTWQFSINSGTSWTNFGTPTAAAARLLASLAATKIRFLPNANFVGSATFVFVAWDQTTGANGGTGVATTRGDTKAFSLAYDTASIAVTETKAPAAIGIFRSGQFYLDVNNNGAWNGASDSYFTFGNSTDTPLAGDWNGDGKTDIGVWRNGTFYLDLNGNRKWDATDVFFTFGNSTDKPITGDWNGDGKTDVGTFRNGTFYLDVNGNRKWDSSDVFFNFGNATDIPITGDWNGDGKTDVGTFRNGTFFLDQNGSRKWEGASDVTFIFGNPTDLPVTGDWNGDGKTDVGTFRSGTFYLDQNGSHKWEGAIDKVYSFGIASDKPIAGSWGAVSVPAGLVVTNVAPMTMSPTNSTSSTGDASASSLVNRIKTQVLHRLGRAAHRGKAV